MKRYTIITWNILIEWCYWRFVWQLLSLVHSVQIVTCGMAHIQNMILFFLFSFLCPQWKFFNEYRLWQWVFFPPGIFQNLYICICFSNVIFYTSTYIHQSTSRCAAWSCLLQAHFSIFGVSRSCWRIFAVCRSTVL